MGQFYRKGTERELARAQEDLEIMRAAVDRLAAMIAVAGQQPQAADREREHAA